MNGARGSPKKIIAFTGSGTVSDPVHAARLLHPSLPPPASFQFNDDRPSALSRKVTCFTDRTYCSHVPRDANGRRSIVDDILPAKQHSRNQNLRG
jgi:hypothetical protein